VFRLSRKVPAIAAMLASTLASMACCAPLPQDVVPAQPVQPAQPVAPPTVKSKKTAAVQPAPAFVPGPSRDNFMRVRNGMSIVQVEQILGRGREIHDAPGVLIMDWRTPRGGVITGTFRVLSATDDNQNYLRSKTMFGD